MKKIIQTVTIFFIISSILGLHASPRVHRDRVAGRVDVQRPVVPGLRPRLLRRRRPLQPLPRGQQCK